MPVEIGLLRPILWIAGQQKNPSSFKICKPLSRYSLLDKFLSVHENPVIIGQRPEAAIKLPMGIFRECYPISGIVVAGIMELMNMRRIHDAFHLKGGHPVTRKSAGVFVGEDDYLDAKTGISSCLNAFLVKSRIFPDSGRMRFDLEHAVEGRSFLWEKIGFRFNQYSPSPIAKFLVGKALEEGRIESDLGCQFPIRGRFSVRRQRLPYSG